MMKIQLINVKSQGQGREGKVGILILCSLPEGFKALGIFMLVMRHSPSLNGEVVQPLAPND